MADDEKKDAKEKPKAGPQRSPGNGPKDIFSGYILRGGLISPNDTVLMQQAGGMYEAYTEVLRDDQVKNALEQRFRAVTACEWDVEPASESAQDAAVAEFVRSQLKRIGWDRVTGLMLYGVFYGYSVAELLWEVTDDFKLGWKAIKVRRRDRFGFNADSELRLRTMDQPLTGEECPDLYYWHFACGADHDDDPYGKGLAHWLYWPVYFKRNGVKFWLIFLEKFGMPTAVGTFPGGSEQEAIDKLLDAGGSMSTDSVIAIPEGFSLEPFEASRSGTSDYETLCKYMDAAITKATVGQTLTTEVGDSGSRALGDVHMDVKQSIAKADADLICESFNDGPVRHLVDANFNVTAYPRVHRKIEAEDDLTDVAERDGKIFQFGFRPTLQRVTEVYGEGYEEKPEPEPQQFDKDGKPIPPKPGAKPAPAKGKKPAKEDDDTEDFATASFPDQVALDTALDEFEAGGGVDVLRRALGPALRMLEQEGPQATLIRFSELYALDVRPLQDRIARMMLVAHIWGRHNARD